MVIAKTCAAFRLPAKPVSCQRQAEVDCSCLKTFRQDRSAHYSGAGTKDGRGRRLINLRRASQKPIVLVTYNIGLQLDKEHSGLQLIARLQRSARGQQAAHVQHFALELLDKSANPALTSKHDGIIAATHYYDCGDLMLLQQTTKHQSIQTEKACINKD